MIAVINYGVGNVRSVLSALHRLDVEACLTADPDQIEDADGVILPGVGAFAEAMQELRSADLVSVLQDAGESDRPMLGICLGVQLLFGESLEHGTHEGLGLVDGKVRLFEGDMKVPHMGWNQVSMADDCPLFEGVEDQSYFYFAHSYYVDPGSAEVVAGRTDYGTQFTSAIQQGTLFGTQFHPEKSGDCGETVLKNFATLCKRS